MASISSQSPYSFFDSIVCINLEHRQDRREEVSRVFKKLNIPAEFYIVKKHPKKGRYGCFQSHIDVISSAYNSKKETILIFEDDIFETPEYSVDKIAKCVNFMKAYKGQWDAFYLGYFPLGLEYGLKQFAFAPHVNGDNNIVQFTPLATHAYCLSRSGMKHILDNYQKYIDYMHIDVMYNTKLNLRSFCYTPTLFDQLLCSPHDNEILDLKERFIRSHQCLLYHINACHKASKLTFMKTSQIVNVILILIAIFIVSK